MSEFAHTLLHVNIEDEVKSAYLDYSMSVIIGRALPDVRDGLKPVHRRILYAMYKEGLLSNRRYSKCAGVVGEVLKKYHPHGDSAVYDALVRMAQPWVQRHLLVDGQGNFGSMDGDPAAAYRYTECRMTKASESLLTDIDKDTINFTPNFDGSHEEPVVLPAAYPNLLVNGSDGIAVGMATKIPPHNLREVISGCIAILDDPQIDLPQLMKHIPAPDFPTGATIYGREGVWDAYSTGRGRIVIRGSAKIEEIDGRQAIIIDELPYQVNKARFVEEIANLVKSKRIIGVSALRDESNRQGMRVVVELKRDAVGEVILNKLYKHTPLQSTFGVILLAIVNNRPQILTLRETLDHYLAHRRVVTIRRTQYLLRKAKERAHILEGYRIALDNLDEVISIIRTSRTVELARERLMERFGLTPIQSQAILDMRLQRLTGMESDKIEAEYKEIKSLIGRLEEILGNADMLKAVIRKELLDIMEQFGDERRTKIVEAKGEFVIQDLIAKEDQIVTFTHAGYIKRTSQSEYNTQRRGGQGKRAMTTRDEDFVTNIFVANTHALILAFTTLGRMYTIPVHTIPEASRTSKGRPIVNLIPITQEEKVQAVISVPDLNVNEDLLFFSKLGLVKRTKLSKYNKIRTSGVTALGIAENDELLTVRLGGPDEQPARIVMLTKNGLAILFEKSQIRSVGRTAQGVRGIRLTDGDQVVDAEIIPENNNLPLLTVTEFGYGKRTEIGKYNTQNRGGKGVITIKTDERNGKVVGAVQVDEHDKVMLVTDTGRVIQIPVNGIAVVGRNTKGVTLMKVDEDERVVGIARVLDKEEESIEESIDEKLIENEEMVVEPLGALEE